jgi:hypothetical protein
LRLFLIGSARGARNIALPDDHSKRVYPLAITDHRSGDR